MALGIVASLAGGLLGASASKKAAAAQQAAAREQTALEREIYQDTVKRFQPFYEGGRDYYNALRFELLGGDRPVFGGNPLAVNEFTETIPGQAGRGPSYGNQGGMIRDPNDPERWIDPNTLSTTRTRFRVGDQVFDDRAAADEFARANPTGGTEYRGFEATPYQQYILDTSREAVDSSAASRGSLFSGATMKAQQDRANALAGGFYGEYLDRLTGQAGQGQAAAGNLAAAGQNFASGAGAARFAGANAAAAGTIGAANALTGGIGNALGTWNYMNQSQPSGGTANIFSAPWASGGFWG